MGKLIHKNDWMEYVINFFYAFELLLYNRPQSGSVPYSSKEAARGYDCTTIHDLDVGNEKNDKSGSSSKEEEKEGNTATTCNSFNPEIEASSIIKLNNGDVLYMKEINR